MPGRNGLSLEACCLAVLSRLRGAVVNAGRVVAQDLDRLLQLRAKVARWLDGEELHGTIGRAGLPTTFASSKVSLSPGKR